VRNACGKYYHEDKGKKPLNVEEGSPEKLFPTTERVEPVGSEEKGKRL